MSCLPRVIVAATGDTPHRGLLLAGGPMVPCALGRAGIRPGKRPQTVLPTRALRPDDGWCDDPTDRLYNRPVRLPYEGRHEDLWRADGLYDVIVVLDYNLAHPRAGAGSAIFLHIAAPGLGATQGCIAVASAAMRRLLTRIGPTTVFDVR